MQSDFSKVLVTEEEIDKTVRRMAEEISRDYEGKNLVLLGILKGSVVFMGDLMRAIKVPCYIDFMSVSSYGSGTTSSGVVKIIKDLDTNVIEGKNLLIVEDILDSGRTLNYLKQYLGTRNPESIKICTLLDKPDRRDPNLKGKLIADYAGALIPDAFVVGYGLDYDEKYRNLPYVGILKPSVYGGE